MTPQQVAMLTALYAPSSRELAESLSAITAGISDSLTLLGNGPTLNLIAQAQAQARGLEQYLSRVREAVMREGGQ